MPTAEQPAPPPRVDVVIGIVTRAGKVLICQRPAAKSFGGYWEFPGGKREPDETLEECLVRELREELALGVTPLCALRPLDHDYPRGRIRLHPFICSTSGGEPHLLECQNAIWVAPEELKRYQFPPANDALLDDVTTRLAEPRKPG